MKNRLSPIFIAAGAVVALSIFILFSMLFYGPEDYLNRSEQMAQADGLRFHVASVFFGSFGVGAYVGIAIVLAWAVIVFFRETVGDLALRAVSLAVVAVSGAALFDLLGSQQLGGSLGFAIGSAIHATIGGTLGAILMIAVFGASVTLATDFGFVSYVREARDALAVADEEDDEGDAASDLLARIEQTAREVEAEEPAYSTSARATVYEESDVAGADEEEDRIVITLRPPIEEETLDEELLTGSDAHSVREREPADESRELLFAPTTDDLAVPQKPEVPAFETGLAVDFETEEETPAEIATGTVEDEAVEAVVPGEAVVPVAAWSAVEMEEQIEDALAVETAAPIETDAPAEPEERLEDETAVEIEGRVEEETLVETVEQFETEERVEEEAVVDTESPVEAEAETRAEVESAAECVEDAGDETEDEAGPIVMATLAPEIETEPVAEVDPGEPSKVASASRGTNLATTDTGDIVRTDEEYFVRRRPVELDDEIPVAVEHAEHGEGEPETVVAGTDLDEAEEETVAPEPETEGRYGTYATTDTGDLVGTDEEIYVSQRPIEIDDAIPVSEAVVSEAVTSEAVTSEAVEGALPFASRPAEVAAGTRATVTPPSAPGALDSVFDTLLGPAAGPSEEVPVLRDLSEPKQTERTGVIATLFGKKKAKKEPAGLIDPLLDEAAALAIERGRASVVLLQRRLDIGYTRASRLIEALEHQGLAGPLLESGSRDILMTSEEWERRRR